MARRKYDEFKPDQRAISLPKLFYMTDVQRNRLAKWSLYALTILGLLIVQDVIMSQFRFFGGTTDLAVTAILLITVIEGVHVGSLFVLVASLLYYFSGSAGSPYCIGLLSFIGIGAALFRQLCWHRNRRSIVMCAGFALMLYEIGMWVTGMMSGLTRWDCLGSFLFTGVVSWLIMIPLYNLINKIGLIGGNTWTE